MSLSPLNPLSLDAERSLPDASGATSLLPVPAGALAPDFPPAGSGEQGAGSEAAAGSLEQGAGSAAAFLPAPGSPLPAPGSLLPSAPSGKTARQWHEAERRHRLVLLFRSLQAEGLSGRAAAERIRDQVDAHCSHPSLSRWDRDERADGFAGLFDNRELAGRPRKHQLHEKETRALKAAYLATNRTADSGSVAEAVRLAHRQGALRPELAADFLERDRTGRMVPRALAAEITAAPAVVRQHRNPTDAALDFLNAPGASMWLNDERTGEERPVRVGDILEADDATVNFPVCVPWELGGDPCSERWGVRVARFQWLVAIDRASRFVPGWSYTARPRSSYRAEDLLSLFHGLFREHGVWQRVCLERGSWEAHKVSAMLEQLRITRMTAWSPHQKTYIEGLFNLLWTKLSDLPGQVGRFQGEEEAASRILTSCQRGATDPRLHFPMLGTALEAFRRATAERNAQAVKSPQFGTWVPQERWLAQQAEARERGRLRILPAEAAWLFAPEMREWTVAGNTVGGSVQVMEGLSLRFDFAAEWLVEFAGAKVRVHFDPAAPRCEATVVLAQNVRDHRAGEVLGTAVQVNKTARYARKVLGWGDDADLGLQMRQQAATALRREVRTIRAGGGTGLSVTESRDGLGNSLTVERGAGSAERQEEDGRGEAAAARPVRGRELAVTAPRRGTNPFAPATAGEFAAAGSRLARLRARQDATEALK